MQVKIEADGREEVMDLGAVAEREVAPAMTEESAKAAGLDPREIADAKRTGLLSDLLPAAPAPAAPAEPPAAPAPAAPAAPPRDLMDEDPDPSKEAARVKEFTDNEKALYWKNKKAQHRAQRAERTVASQAAQISELQKQLAEKKAPAPADPFLDPDAPPVPPDPVKEKAEKDAADLKARQERQAAARQALDEQERDFKISHPDFDKDVDLATEIADIVDKGDQVKLREMFPDALVRRGVVDLVREFGMSIVYAADPNLPRPAPEVALELASIHPKRKTADRGAEPAEPTAAVPPKLPTPPAPSSASLTGGGAVPMKRILDITAEEFTAMKPDQVRRLKEKYPKEYDQLMRKIA